MFRNLTKKYHQYRKRWTSKTGVTSTVYLIERVLWPNFVFLPYCMVIWQKNITISKKVNLQNWCQIEFLSNRMRVMDELRFLRFWVIIWLKNITNIEKSEPPKLVSNRLFIKENESYGRIRFFTILSSNLTKKYHQYWKKWTSKTGFKSTFYPIERELRPNYNFLRFLLVIWLKNITNIEECEPPKLVSNSQFT